MPDFLVKMKIQQTQLVLVTDAKDREDALDKARDGEYEPFSDLEHDCFVASDTWKTERIKE